MINKMMTHDGIFKITENENEAAKVKKISKRKTTKRAFSEFFITCGFVSFEQSPLYCISPSALRSHLLELGQNEENDFLLQVKLLAHLEAFRF